MTIWEENSSALFHFKSNIVLSTKKRSHIFQNPGQSGQKAKANYTIVES